MSNPANAHNMMMFNELHDAKRRLVACAAAPIEAGSERAKLEKLIDRLRADLINANMPLVASVANRYHHSAWNWDDLVSAGKEGLIKAIDGFDPTLGYQFSTYAMNFIRGAISAELANQKLIRISREKRAKMRLIEECKAILRKLNGVEPTDAEVAARLGFTKKAVRELSGLTQPIRSLDGTTNEGTPLGELEADPKAPDPADEAQKADDIAALRSACGVLGERELMVVRSYFGLGGYEPLSLEEIGQALGLSGEGVRQILKLVLLKLKKAMSREGRPAAASKGMVKQAALPVVDKNPTGKAKGRAQVPVGMVRVAMRKSAEVNHHIYENNGSWFTVFSLQQSDKKSSRFRTSLATHEAGEARKHRDRILDILASLAVPYVCTLEQLGAIVARVISAE